MSAILRHLGALLLLLFALWAAAGWCDRWLRSFAWPLRLPLRIAAGAGIVTAALFFLASVQLLRPPLVLATVLLLAAAGLLAARSPGRSPRAPATADAPVPAAARAATLVLGAALSLLVFVLVVQALRPTVAWDAEVYHLTVPRLYLEHGGFYRIPWNVYSNWPLGTQLLYAFCLALDGPQLASLLHLACALLAALLLAGLAAGPQGRVVGWAAAALFLAHPVLLYEVRQAYVDCAFALFLLAAFALLEQRRGGGGGDRATVWLAGVFAGLAAGTKLNGFFGALCLGAVYVLAARVSGVRLTLADLGRFGAAAALVLAPWLIKTWWLTGNPVYPLLHGAFGGSEWNAALAAQHAAWQRAIGMGRGAIDTLLLPWRVLCCGDFGYRTFDGALHRASMVLVPLGLLGLIARGGPPRERRAAAVAGLYVLLWALTSQQMRFLIPILPLLALAVAAGLLRILRRLFGGALPQLVLAATAAALLWQAAWIYTRQTPRLLSDLVRHGERLDRAVVHPLYLFLEERVPRDARLLLVNTNHTFRIRQPALADSFFEASQVADAFAGAATAGEAAEVLARLGVGYLVFEHRDRGIRFAPGLVALLDDPERARLVFRSPDQRFSVFELRHSSSM